MQGPTLDPCGGLPGSGTKWGLSKTEFFHVEKKGERWFLVDPEGNVFFHLGVCCFSPVNATWVGGREAAFEWIPPREGEFATAYPLKGEDKSVDYYNANVIRKYGRPVDPAEFAVRMIGRVRRLGFNSTGCFTAPPDLTTWRWESFPYVLKLPCDPWEGFWYLPGGQRIADPFDDKLRAQFDKMCAATIPARAEDPYLIGYFNDNEPIYEDIGRVVAALKGSQFPCKRRLVDSLLTLVDQPASGTWWGRYDGECANTGLFSIVDRPWKPAVEQMARTNHAIYEVLFGSRPAFVWEQPRSRTDGASK